MPKQKPLQKVWNFFLTKMVVSTGVMVLLVAFMEGLRSLVLDKTNLPGDIKTVMVSVGEASVVTAAYIFVFRSYDKRVIQELSAASFLKYASMGFVTGVMLQSLFILVIYLAGTFWIVQVNPVSAVLSPFAFALTAGFVAEIIMIGIVFRLLEQQTGTKVALALFILLFALLHVNVKGASFISVGATALQAGFMLPSAYVFSRSLWLPVFLHFGWDFAEPGIFGGVNPSSSLRQGLFTSKISGNFLFTGGNNGPQDSLSSLFVCLLVGLVFLLLAKHKNNLRRPGWQIRTASKAT